MRLLLLFKFPTLLSNNPGVVVFPIRAPGSPLNGRIAYRRVHALVSGERTPDLWAYCFSGSQSHRRRRSAAGCIRGDVEQIFRIQIRHRFRRLGHDLRALRGIETSPENENSVNYFLYIDHFKCKKQIFSIKDSDNPTTPIAEQQNQSTNRLTPMARASRQIT